MSKESSLKLEEAKREPFDPSILLSGPSGSGKTYSALLLASAIGKKIVLVDTEHRRSARYAKLFKFKAIYIEPPYTPERYREAVKLALASAPDVLIVDSATHEWVGRGGILPSLDEMPGTNSAIKWKNLTPRHDRFMEILTQKPKCTYIVTVRAKEKLRIEEQLKDGVKKAIPVRLGMLPIQRYDFRYDFDFCYTLGDTHRAKPLKTLEEAPLPDGPISEAFGKKLYSWCRMKGGGR